MDVAARHGVPCDVVERTDFTPSFDRDRYTSQVTAALRDLGADLIVMAGFGTVLGRAVHDAFPHRILNTHPALLPSFPGWHGVADALAYYWQTEKLADLKPTKDWYPPSIFFQGMKFMLFGDPALSLPKAGKR